MKSYLLSFFCLVLTFQALASEEIIKRKYYTLSYNEDHEVANWVSYELDHSRIRNCVKRNNNFRSDPDISTGSADEDDYRGSGYDRGHLVPAGDMKFTREAMSDTFYFSNMTPQPSKFNQTRWAQLENLMRSWALRYQKIWIVTGPVLRNNLPVVGNRNRVSVPDTYFKVVLRKNGNSYEGIGFLMSTSIPYDELSSYATSINKVEELTQIDFFKFLDDKIEEDVEEKFNTSNWSFSGRFEYLPCQL
jgi:endonuclease G, mitochondrial